MFLRDKLYQIYEEYEMLAKEGLLDSYVQVSYLSSNSKSQNIDNAYLLDPGWFLCHDAVK